MNLAPTGQGHTSPGHSLACLRGDGVDLLRPGDDWQRWKNAGWKPRMRRQIVAWRRKPQVF
ncbi:MAG: hypothetical protein ACLQVF_47445, partial [Isosphaeraceae bacterium]